jgi:tetratricopeptide (TPR) repeat protein
MYCLQCGSHNPDNAAFCEICGKQLEKGTSPPPVMPIGEVPVSVDTQSPAGEYIPTGQEMPPLVSFPISQEDPTIHYVAQPGYGMPQSYPPSAYTPVDQYQAAEMFGSSRPAYTEQSSSSIENDQTIPQMPSLQPDRLPYDHPEALTTPPPVAPEPWYKTLAKPMPIWAFIVCIVAVVGLLVVLQLTGSDWAAGAMHLAIGAGIIAVVIALATVVRTFLGMGAKTNPRRVFQFVSAGLSILLLLAFCLVGLTQQSTIHSLQAHNLEGQQQWQLAINEYQLAGEGAPASENIARVYNEWGEQFNSQQRYEDAFAKFNIVMNNYGSATSGVDRAWSDTIKAYLGWGQQASQQHDYTAATSHYDALLQLSYCTTTCQAQASALDATASYNLGESQLAAKNYTDAINTFGIVMSRFPSSPEAQKLHGDLARALFGQGQQQLAALCTSAIPIYQQLSTQFADTPEGQQAKTALAAPQPVKGHFIGVVPNNTSLTQEAALMQGLRQDLPTNQFFQMLSSSPTAIIQSNGSFSFKPIKQGSYDLAWGTNNNVTGSQSFVSYFKQSDGSPVYVANVGPLCPYDFGDINQNIPAAS